MKPTALLLLAALALAACGGDESTAPQPATTAPAPEAAAAPDAPPAAPVGVPEAADAPAPAPASDLTPADVSPDTPVDVVRLRDAVFAFNDQPATVAGYLHTNSGSDRGVQPFRDFYLKAEPGAAETNDGTERVRCSQTARYADRVAAGQPVVVRGTMGRPYPLEWVDGGAVVQLDDCEIVSVGEAAPASAETAQALFDRVLAWAGTEVALQGRYNGHGSSSATGLTTVRIQAPRTAGLTEQIAACALAEGGTVPEAASDDREGVVWRGRIGPADTWLRSRNTLPLEGCTFVNR